MPASVYTPEIAAEIIDRLSNGEPLAQICRDERMPGLRTVYDWAEADPDLSARIARAREAGYDIIATDALRIADTPIEGVTTKITDKGVEETREDMLGHRKLQVETRLKLLAKWDRKRYGESKDVNLGGQPGNPLKTESVAVHVDPNTLPDADREAILRIAHRVLQAGS